MTACPYCQSENKDRARFCSHCGFELKAFSPLAAGMLLDRRYRIIREIGGGGMSIVYKASDARLGNIVRAIKEIRPTGGLHPDERAEAIRLFRREAEMLATLDHANLPKVYDFFLENGGHYLVMDYIDGWDLRWMMNNRRDELSQDWIVQLLVQLCDALGYLHSQKPSIIFRDAKPSNIMISRAGELKLIDFGIARVFESHKARDTYAMGTPGYAAPEQYGHSQTDARSDIYSLGVVFHELLTGHDPAETPFCLPSVTSLDAAIPVEYELIIQRATNLDPSKRYASAREMRADLLGWSPFVKPDFRRTIDVRRAVVGVSRCPPGGSPKPKHLQPWTTYTHAKGVNALAVEWAGNLWTAGAGAVRWDLDAGTYEKYTTDHGLPSNACTAVTIMQGREAWLGTVGGVAHFDGSHWTAYTAEDGLFESEVCAMSWSPNGVLAGFWEGICHFDGKRWTKLATPPQFHGIECMLVTRDGVLWCGVFRNGVFSFNGKEWRHYSLGDPEFECSVHDLALDYDGGVWCATPAGAFRFDGQQWMEYSIWQGVQDKALWIHTGNQGIHQFDGKRWTVVDKQPLNDGASYVSIGIQAIYVDSQGNLWLGTSEGIFFYDFYEDKWSVLGKAAELGGMRFRDIQEYPTGRLCFATDRGLYTIVNSELTSYAVADKVELKNSCDIAITPDGAVWVATSDGVCRFDGRNWTRYTENDGLLNNVVTVIAKAPDGGLWCGTPRGISIFDGNSWTELLGAPPDIHKGYLSCIEFAPDGTVWLGTSGRGAFHLYGGRWETYTEDFGLVKNEIRAIATTEDGLVWFGTTQGVSVFDGQRWRTFTTVTGLTSDRVECIAVARDGRVWLGTPEGISAFDGVRWRSYRQADGLVDDAVSTIAESQDGSLWFGSARGISRFKGGLWSRVSSSHGPATRQVRALAITEDGILWVAGHDGVFRFEPPAE